MIRKATLKQLDNALIGAGRPSEAYWNVFTSGVAVFTTSGDNAVALGRYCKRRFPSLWADYVAVAYRPTVADFWENTAAYGVARLVVTFRGRSYWVIEP